MAINSRDDGLSRRKHAAQSVVTIAHEKADRFVGSGVMEDEAFGALEIALECAQVEPLSICYQVHGPIRVATLGRFVAVACGGCGQTSGPWLLSAGTSGAFFTCKCGARATHRKITREVVERHAGVVPECAWPSLAAAERGLGYGH